MVCPLVFFFAQRCACFAGVKQTRIGWHVSSVPATRSIAFRADTREMVRTKHPRWLLVLRCILRGTLSQASNTMVHVTSHRRPRSIPFGIHPTVAKSPGKKDPQVIPVPHGRRPLSPGLRKTALRIPSDTFLPARGVDFPGLQPRVFRLAGETHPPIFQTSDSSFSFRKGGFDPWVFPAVLSHRRIFLDAHKNLVHRTFASTCELATPTCKST